MASLNEVTLHSSYCCKNIKVGLNSGLGIIAICPLQTLEVQVSNHEASGFLRRKWFSPGPVTKGRALQEPYIVGI